MDISVFGLGYVGAVSAGCLATDGHNVVGVDPNAAKVDLVNSGVAPIIEDALGEMISAAAESGRLRATTCAYEAVHQSDISLICVGTPSQLNGNLDLSYVRRVCEEIGEALRDKSDYHVVVARSTMLPGSMRNVVIPTLESASGERPPVPTSASASTPNSCAKAPQSPTIITHRRPSLGNPIPRPAID